MAGLYELIGRLVIKFVWARYGRQIRVAAAIVTAIVAVAGYAAATRQPPEG
jgi:hypothetical protein